MHGGGNNGNGEEVEGKTATQASPAGSGDLLREFFDLVAVLPFCGFYYGVFD